MKLLLLALAITLCATLPPFRDLKETIDNSDLAEIFEPFDYNDNVGFPRWLQDISSISEEEALLGVSSEEASLEADLLPEIRADPLANDIFNFGLENVIASGIDRGKIPSTTFKAVSVSYWNVRKDSYGEWSTFNAVAVSDDGTSVVEMNFVVYYDYATQEKTLNSYTSTTTTTTITSTTPEIPETPPETTETPGPTETPEVPPIATETTEQPEEPQNEELVVEEEAVFAGEENEDSLPDIRANPFLNDIFEFGLTNVIASGISKGKIPKAVFNAVNVTDWERKDNKNREWYRFTAAAVSEDGASVVEMNFTVTYDQDTQEKALRAYSFKITTVTVTTTPVTPVTPEVPVVVEEPQKPEKPEKPNDGGKGGRDSTTTTTTTTTTTNTPKKQ